MSQSTASIFDLFVTQREVIAAASNAAAISQMWLTTILNLTEWMQRQAADRLNNLQGIMQAALPLKK